MATIKLTETIVKSRHPELHEEFVTELRNSKTKSKDTPEDKFKFAYSWSERIESDTFDDIINGKAQARDAEYQLKTLNQKIQNRQERSFVHLEIKAGRVSRYYSLDTLPVEVTDAIQKQEEDSQKERLRIESLSPKEK